MIRRTGNLLKIFMVGQINKHLLPIGMLLLISILFFYNQDLIGPVAFLIVGGGFLYAGFYIRSKNHKKSRHCNFK